MPCMWKRLAGRPTGDPRLVQAQVHPPAGAVLNVPSFCIGRSLAPWIIRTRHGPQPEEKSTIVLDIPHTNKPDKVRSKSKLRFGFSVGLSVLDCCPG